MDECILIRITHIYLPGYESPLAPFGAGTMSGYATLESIRVAVSASKFTTMSSSAQLAMYGYSGDSFATE